MSVRRLLGVGNAKLGESIHHFDLPAVSTCPGRSSICEASCYATKGHFCTPVVQQKLQWCLKQSRRKDFAQRMAEEIHARGVLIVRIHVAGDFYSAAYAKKWLEVMKARPRARYYLYTRSWRRRGIAAVMEEMAALPCCRVWYSVDRETGLPTLVPEGVRLAYLQDSEDVPEGVDLRFLLRRFRREPARLGLPLICPSETPQGKSRGINCGNCTHCWE